MLRLAPVQCGLDVLDGRWTDEPMAAVLFCEWMMVVASKSRQMMVSCERGEKEKGRVRGVLASEEIWCQV